METSPLSAADIAAVAKDDDFGGGWMWIIVLFLFMYGNGWNRGNGTEPVTEAGLCNAMNFNNLENAVGRMSDQQAAIARQTDSGICNLGYETCATSRRPSRPSRTATTRSPSRCPTAAARQTATSIPLTTTPR